MIKLVIFDMDGVLVDAKPIHFNALNEALKEVVGPEAVITIKEHLSTFDGLSTTKKLELLQERGRIPKNQDICDRIWNAKQSKTFECIRKQIKHTDYIEQVELLRYLRKEGYAVWVASNAIRLTILDMLAQSGYSYVDGIKSNQDVNNPKPHPEIYMRIMLEEGVSPAETVIVEDSHIGRKAAAESGAHVIGVRDHTEVTFNNIISKLKKLNKAERISPKWQGGKMNVLIPMAGAGSRFAEAGYTFPKPLIEVKGKPMIQLVTENLNIDSRHIFIVQKEHYDKYNLRHVLNLISPFCEIVQVDGITEGAACTTLLAQKFIDNNEPLVIANSDQYVEWDSNEFLYACSSDSIDGGILTHKSIHPKWSYAKTDEDGFVTEVAEKKPISDNATVGIYYWSRGSDYVKYANQMIEKDIRVNNEFYVCPVYNELIGDGGKVKIFPVSRMWGLGTPEDLKIFLEDK